MKHIALGVGVGAVALATASASGQAVTQVNGGSLFAIFYGGSTGDVVGWRFTVSSPIKVTHLGVFNDGSLDSDHQVGIWDDTMTLLTSNTVTPGGSTQIGQFNYEPSPAANLVPGVTYTAGAMYTATDNDSYISSPSSITTAPEITVIQGVFPSAGSLGFVFPTNNSTNLGRYGPNFLFVPGPGAAALFGLGGLIAARRRR
jgi:hypothetical protein